jgi:hypothetical protein
MPFTTATGMGSIVGMGIVSIPRSAGEDRQEFVGTPRERVRAARGALTGILLGAGMWGAILVLAAAPK